MTKWPTPTHAESNHRLKNYRPDRAVDRERRLAALTQIARRINRRQNAVEQVKIGFADHLQRAFAIFVAVNLKVHVQAFLKIPGDISTILVGKTMYKIAGLSIFGLI